MVTLLINNELVKRLQKHMRSPDNLEAMQRNLLNVFVGSPNERINLASRPLFIITRDRITHDDSTVRNGRMVIWDRLSGKEGQLNVMESASVSFSPNEYTIVELSRGGELSTDIDEVYNILCRVKELRPSAAGDEINTQYIADMVVDAIRYETKGPYDAAAAMAEAQLLYDMTDVKGVSFSESSLDEHYRMILTGEDVTAERAFGGGKRSVIVRDQERFGKLLRHARPMGTGEGSTRIGAPTSIFVLSSTEEELVSELFAEYVGGELIDKDIMESRLINILADKSGNYNARQLAGFKMQQWISMASEELGSDAVDVLDNNIVVEMYERILGGGGGTQVDAAISISGISARAPGSVANQLYLDVTEYKTSGLGHVFEGNVLPVSSEQLERLPDIVAPRYFEDTSRQALGEALHDILDDTQGRQTVSDVIDDIMGGTLRTSGLDVETPTDRRLREKLYRGIGDEESRVRFLAGPTDKPLISAGFYKPGGDIQGVVRQISEGEAEIWRTHYQDEIERIRKGTISKGRRGGRSIKLGAARSVYYKTGRVGSFVTPSMTDALSDITKWVGGIYGTGFYDKKGINKMAGANEYLKEIGRIVRDVKGIDKFGTVEAGLAHFERLTPKGRTRLINEWLVQAHPSRISNFLNMADKAIDEAVDFMMAGDTSPEDLLFRILGHVTESYDPNRPRDLRLRADVYDINVITDLYNQVKANRGMALTSATADRFELFKNMQRANIADAVQSVAAVAKSYGITKTIEGTSIPRSGAIDKIVQSGFLTNEVVEDLVASGALWDLGEGRVLEPHVGSLDLRIGAAIHDQLGLLLNETVNVGDTPIKLGDLVQGALSRTTGIVTTDPDANLFKFSWKEAIGGIYTDGEMQHIYFSRQQAPAITKETAALHGIDWNLTREMQEEGVKFADDRGYMIGGRQTARLIGVEEGPGGSFILTMEDAVTGRIDKIATTSEEAARKRFLPRYDVRVGPATLVAEETWEDVVVRSLDDYNRIVHELSTGKGKATGRMVNAPRTLRKMFEEMEPMAGDLGVSFWEAYDKYKAGDASEGVRARSILSAIENNIAEGDVVKRGQSASKILSRGRFVRERDKIWGYEASRPAENVKETVTLLDENRALIDERKRLLRTTETSYGRGVTDISEFGDDPFGHEVIRKHWNRIIDRLDEGGFVPGSHGIPGVDPDDVRRMRSRSAEEYIISAETEAIQLGTTTGDETRQEAMATRIRRGLSTLDITDPDALYTEEITADINRLSATIIGTGEDLDTSYSLLFPDLSRGDDTEFLMAKIESAERTVSQELIPRSELTPLVKAIRGLGDRGSITSIIENIGDAEVQGYLESKELEATIREMDTKTLGRLAVNISSRTPLPDAAIPLSHAVDIAVDDMFGFPHFTATDSGYLADLHKSARSYADDIGRSVAENITPRTIMTTAAVLGTLAVINSAFADRVPEKHRIKGTGYVTPSGQYIDDPDNIELHTPPEPSAVQGRGFRMRVSGISSHAQASGFASAMRDLGSVSVRQGTRKDVDNTNRKRMMDRFI